MKLTKTMVLIAALAGIASAHMARADDSYICNQVKYAIDASGTDIDTNVKPVENNNDFLVKISPVALTVREMSAGAMPKMFWKKNDGYVAGNAIIFDNRQLNDATSYFSYQNLEARVAVAFVNCKAQGDF